LKNIHHRATSVSSCFVKVLSLQARLHTCGTHDPIICVNGYFSRAPQVASSAAVAAAASILAVGATAAPALAAAATSKSGYDLTPMSQQEVEEKAKAFNDLQKRVRFSY
jgi:hypothetical protein